MSFGRQMNVNPRIDELRARLKTDAASRHFYPLGEELRKIGELEEAEQVLRDGLVGHPNYLSAWISLGRVLRDQGKHREAVEILQRAFSLDGSNVVTARLMAESYLELGEKVEAIKKFKLVRALLPRDDEIENRIAALEQELNPAPAQEVTSAPLDERPEPGRAERQEEGARDSGEAVLPTQDIGGPDSSAASALTDSAPEPEEAGTDAVEQRDQTAGDAHPDITAKVESDTGQPPEESVAESSPFGDEAIDSPFGGGVAAADEPAARLVQGDRDEEPFDAWQPDAEEEPELSAPAPGASDEAPDSPFASGERELLAEPHDAPAPTQPKTARNERESEAASAETTERLQRWLAKVRRNADVS